MHANSTHRHAAFVSAAVAAALAAALAPGAARAQAQAAAPWTRGRDVVELRDGTRLEGEALDVRLGDQLTLRLPSGALRVVLWPEVLRASGFAFSAATLRAIPPPPPEPPPAALGARAGDAGGDPTSAATPRGRSRYLTAQPGTVPVELVTHGEPLRVSVVGPARAVAELIDASETVRVGGEFALDQPLPGAHDPIELGPLTEYACTTPCTLHMYPGRVTIQTGGPGRVEATHTIEVGEQGERVVLHSASAAAFGGGVVLALFGGSLALVGGLALLVDATGGASSPGLPLATVGGVLLGVGAAGLAVGIPILAGVRTGVERIEAPRRRAEPTSATRGAPAGAPRASERAAAAPVVRVLGGGVAPDLRGGAVASMLLAF